VFKRIVAVPLWFVSVWLMYGLVAYFLGLPSGIGAVLGALAGAIVWLDPAGVLWAHQPRTVATTNTADALEPAARLS
jgi:hypothetical protein